MAFLPENYELPKVQGNYFKPQDGDNKIRILSKPIIGWEDWQDKTPVRTRLDNKPEKLLGDSAAKQFWSMIVYDYSDGRIKIWTVIQATIMRSIETLVKDSEWGAPYSYDLKIHRSGKEKNTKYSITPSPKKRVTDDIIDAFDKTPIYLEAIYQNDDPFADHGVRTPGEFDDTKPKNDIITLEQKLEIKTLLQNDKEYAETLNQNLKKHYNCTLDTLPKSIYKSILKSIQIHLANKEEVLPF